jgi:hypothetical protein
MRSCLALLVVACVIPACVNPPASPARAPHAQTSSSSGNATVTLQAQPFNLFTHCGILTTYFAGRVFYLAELDPARVHLSGNPGNPEVAGTMTLLSSHAAVFVDPEGDRIPFVDQLPGALGTPYSFAVHVMSGGSQLSDEPFAGRRWHTTETLPGVIGPPYGNGQDRSTLIRGSFTTLDAQHALFRTQAGAILHYTALPLAGCD